MYDLVNEAVNRVFLGGRFESRPLYLVLDNRGRDELADILEEDPAEVEAKCCQAVGDCLARTGDPYKDFQAAFFKWRASGRRTLPPFTALLFTLSHAAELMVSDGEYTAGNYYQRLAQLTGVESQKLSFHGKSTATFWNSFNRWLADTDFRYGRPTARPVNSFKYVSLAISQAIVREADRQRLHDLFEKYGFTGTDVVTEEEISQYISSWIVGSRPTRQLKASWAKQELRPRICEIAVAELEEWAEENANARGGPDKKGSRLSLALSFKHELFSRSVSLWLGKETSLDLVRLRGEGEAYCLSNTTFGSLATVEPRSAIDWSSVLLRGLDLVDEAGSHHTWAARSVIPLSRSEKGGYWTEVGRVTLGVPHLVLARADATIRANVELTLEEIAAPGYTVSVAEALPGMPTGWVLYENVRIIRSLEELRGVEAVLSPVGATSGLQLVGGLRLGRGIWHEWAAPVAVFDSEVAGTKIAAWEGTSREGEPVAQATSEGTETVLRLEQVAHESGNIYIEVLEGTRTLASSTLLLRTAEKARPQDRQSRGILAYEGCTTATPLAETSGLVVRGCDVDAPGGELADAAILDRFATLGAPHDFLDEASEPEIIGSRPPETAPSDLSNMPLAELLNLPCAVRGFHVFRLDTVPPDYPKYAPVNMECKDCHVALLHRRKAKSQAATKRATPRRAVPPTPRASQTPSPGDLPFDLWLDAACFLGAGTTANLETLTAHEELEPWRIRAIMRDFAWLGHLDVQNGPDNRPRYWSVAPPALAFIGDQEAMLTGFRTASLVNDVTSLVEASGGSVSRSEVPGQPAIIRVSGLDPDEASAALDVATDVHGRGVVVTTDAPVELGRFCRSAGSPYSCFRTMTLGTEGDLRKYDFERGCWRRAETSSEPGAYTFTYAGTGYALRTTGACFSGPAELVKTAAARLAGTTVHAYDAKERVFISQLGCEPPGLLGRALAVSSGRLPEVRNGTSRFMNVSPGVAATVLACLYEGNLPQ